MSLAEDLPISRLQSVAPILPARNMESSIAFYQRLGFLCEPYEDGSHYAFLSRDGHSLHLGRMEGAEFTFNPGGVYFVIEDVDVYFNEIAARGVTVIHEPEDKPWRMREFAISDPDETLLRFGQPSHLH